MENKEKETKEEKKWIGCTISAILSIMMMLALIFAFTHGLTSKYYIMMDCSGEQIQQVNGQELTHLNLTYGEWYNDKERYTGTARQEGYGTTNLK